jgi:hypothetical protein
MPGILVDSCVLLDVLTEDPHCFDWSAQTLGRCAEHSLLFINPIIKRLPEEHTLAGIVLGAASGFKLQ